ncbi:LamG domain-containing protein [Planctomycetota bacterium]
MYTKRCLIMVAMVGMVMSSAWADIVPIDGAAAGDPNSPPYILESVTVGGVEVPAGELMTGTTHWISNDPNILIADPNLDDFDINTMLQWSGRPGNFQIIFDELWTNTNGDANDFILFEVGGDDGDDPTFAAIFEDGSLGAELHIQPGVNLLPGWMQTEYIRNAADANDGVSTDNQPIAGLAFAITDLFDANGVALTNDAVIKGILLVNRGGTDPSGFYAVAPPAELAHRWTLDEVDTAEGAVIADSVGGLDGVVVGTGVTSLMGVIDNAFAFDGASHVSISDVNTADLKMISVTLWINPDVDTLATGGYKRVFSGGDNFEIILQPDTGQVGNNLYRGGGTYPLSDPLPEGEWTHVAVTSTLISAGGSGDMTVYLNGALNVVSEALAKDDWAGGEMRIAHRPNSNPHFQGMLDEVRIYRGVLTGAQLEAAINGE